jgi:hypothetical protein
MFSAITVSTVLWIPRAAYAFAGDPVVKWHFGKGVLGDRPTKPGVPRSVLHLSRWSISDDHGGAYLKGYRKVF